MVRFWQFVSICYMLIALVGCQTATPTPQHENIVFVGDATQTARNVSIRVDWVKIGENIGDKVGRGELLFTLLVVRETGDSRRLQAPGQGAYSIDKDSKISLDGFSLTVNDVHPDEKILVYFLSLESDELDFASQRTTSIALDAAANVLVDSLVKGKLLGQAVTHSNLLSFIISQLVGAALDWWQEADVLGGYALMLESENNWLLNQTNRVKSDDGNMTVQFTISADTANWETSTVPRPSQFPTKPAGTVTAPTVKPTSTPKPSVTPSVILATPEEFIHNYYATINAQNYQKSWSMLSAYFKQKHNSTGFQPYVDWWKTIQEVKVLSTHIESWGQYSATLSVELSYYYQNGKVDTYDLMRFKVIWDDNTNQWLIDDAELVRGTR